MRRVERLVHIEGQESLEGESYRKLKVQFEGVGLTPGDTYWAYLDPATGSNVVPIDAAQ